MKLKKLQRSQLKSLGIKETKINLFSFRHRVLLFFSPLLYFHVGVTPNNSLLLFMPNLERRDSGPSTGLMIYSFFPIQREKQWIEFLWLNLDFKLHKLNMYIYTFRCIYIYACVCMCMDVYFLLNPGAFLTEPWNAPLKEDLCLR